MRCSLTGARPVRASHSGMFGVTSAARGIRRFFSTAIAGVIQQSRARRRQDHGVQHQREYPLGVQHIGHGGGDFAIAQHADLDGVGADIAQRGFDLAAHDFGIDRIDRLHARVSCTVTAVIAVWQ